jgi:hypothetical protein
VSRSIRLGLAGVMTVLVAVAIIWWLNRESDELLPWGKPASVTGRTIRVTYTGSECQDGSRLEVREDSDRVVLTVVYWTDATSCSDVGVFYSLEGTLSSDLGDRTLIDGACERPEFRGYADCRTRYPQ